jgi:hypothetical protein
VLIAVSKVVGDAFREGIERAAEEDVIGLGVVAGVA